MQTVVPSSEHLSSRGVITQLSALLFDLDGTLANTDPFHFCAWKELLREFGYEIDDEFYKSRISGKLNPAIVQDVLPQLSLSEGQRLIEQKEAYFRELALQLSPLPGLQEVIGWAEQWRFQQAVVTNAPPENVRHTLQALRLESHFSQVVISDELGIGKPDPAPYLHALKQFDIRADQAIAFEDSPSGVRSAVAAGIPTIGIASTQEPEVLYSVGAMLVVADFSAPELWEVLEQRTALN